ncbi:MAG: ribosome biogenesis GTPase Der [Chloroflexi bacterium]|nr:ribosome biogenesis GTPase Der [Chloroflexota bacterium]
MTGKPVVAIVGRPNVGKSTLFNRLVGGRHAIVEDIAGTTRDRLYGEVQMGQLSFAVIDTGGLVPAAEEGYPALIRHQVETAMAEAEVILFLVDVVSGCTSADEEIAQLLRKTDKPVLLVANKADNDRRRETAAEFYELAMGDPILISAYHAIGVGDLRERLEELLPPVEPEAPPETLRLAIVGRPNVGKSALVNAILGQDRVLVSEEPGTTRDAVDTPFEYGGQELVLIDTAGIRRRGKVTRGIEQYSVMRAQEALVRADIGLLVVDASEGLTAQDLHIAGYITDAHKGLIVVPNKWDLVEDTEESRERFANRELRRLRFAPWAPLAFVSAKTGLNIDGLLDLALEVHETRGQRIPTPELNTVIQKAVAAHRPPSKGQRALRILYVTQAEVNPPTFVFFVSDASSLHFSYKRYMEKTVRKAFGFEGTAIRLIFRSKSSD